MNPPVSVAWLINDQLYLAGSEWYRAHRAAHVVGNKLDWLCFVASHFQPPEKAGERFVCETWWGEARRLVSPHVVITRPLFAMQGWETQGTDAAEQMTEAIAYAQEAGQTVIIDMDDHPYGWNAEYAEREHVDPITDWGWLDRYLGQANAILCSTPYLLDFLRGRFPDQHLALAPNLYDPFRFTPRENPLPDWTVGAHLYTGARLRTDFDVLGSALRPLFDKLPELRFIHVGEQRICGCGHNAGAHFEDSGPCDDCACEAWYATETSGHALASLTGLDPARVEALPQASLMELPEKMPWSLGVIPMADNEWNHCKTETKGFEMAAAGIPFFAVTGEHPLYRQSPGWVDPAEYHVLDVVIQSLLTDPDAYARMAELYRTWAIGLAQQHETDYLATLEALANSDLRKSRERLAR